jgi:hypothetical protein
MAMQENSTRSRLALRWPVGSILLACVLLVAQSAAATQTATMHVPAGQPWTDTGINVSQGERVLVVATGQVVTRGRGTAPVGPAGIATPTICNARSQGARPLPSASCWGLLAKVGNGKPLFVGTRLSFDAPASGHLFLGINDLYLADNFGAWNAVVVAGTGPVTVAPAKKRSSSPLPIIVGALLLIAAIVGLVFGLRALAARRRAARHRKPKPAAVPVAATLSTLTEAESDRAPPAARSLVPTDDDDTVVPGADDTTSVNIFSVELDGQTLRVGYSFFPEGTEVRWSIRGDDTLATASFVTQGGGSTQHFVAFELTLPPELQRGVVTVRFDWRIEGVPFEYAVRRELVPVDEH